MAAGDAQRVWFPEMVESLRSQWSPDLSFDAIVKLRDELDTMLQRVRSEQRIRPAILRCRRCGRMVESAAPHVSVRAMILSLLRFGIAAAGQVHPLEKSWAAHRKQKGLDLYGKPLEEMATPVAGCVHRRIP